MAKHEDRILKKERKDIFLEVGIKLVIVQGV